MELVWVLERSYKYSRNEIMAAVMGLVPAAELYAETAQDFAEVSLSDLEEMVRSTGFYRNKAKSIRRAVQRW